ncbi:MAG: hypothetical protein COB40_00030 [Marinosulfonomonas sp.]|nr:MAG: hypothetical protein COB40_00030 [Marinosulfonomonas sp.]
MARPKNTKSIESKADSVAEEVTEPIEDTVLAEDIPDSPEQTQVVQEQPKARRTGFVPLLLGGAVAGVIGFGIAQYSGNDSWPFPKDTSTTDRLNEQVVAQKNQMDALETRIADLVQASENAVSVDVTDGLAVRQDAGDQTDQEFAGLLAALDQRLGDVENRPIPDVGATAQAVATYERELAAMRLMFEQELQRVEDAQTEAIEAQGVVAVRAESVAEAAAMAQIENALDEGTPFADALDALSALGLEIPTGLSAVAGGGVASLARLQDDFPDAARAALNAANQAEADAGKTSGLAAFLRSQLGARSLQPQDGDSADAVLSRAEAALRNADIGGALAELETISDVAKAPLSDWIKTAETRQDTVSAIAALAETMKTQGR